MNAFATWIWQGIAVAVATRVIVGVLPRLNAATRHAIWWMAMAIVLVHPWTPTDAPLAPIVQSVAAVDAPAASMLPPLPHPPMWFGVAALGLWLSLALWRATQVVISLRAIRRLKRESAPFEARREQALGLWQTSRTTGRACELRVSDRVPGPCAIGFIRPVILIPRRLATELSAEELDQVVAHEHAHLQRYDDWLNLLQCAITAAAGIHPAVWVIDRQLDLEREAACDDRVVARTGTPGVYATCLAHVATLLVARSESLAIAPAAVRSSGLLRTRVERLMNRRWNRTLRIRWVPAAAATTMLAVVVIACDQAPPVVTFAEAGVTLPMAVLRQSAVHTAAALESAATAVIGTTSPKRRRGIEPSSPAPITDASQPAQPIGGLDPLPVAAGHEAMVNVASVQIAPAPVLPAKESAVLIESATATVRPAPSVSTSGDGTWSTFGSNIAQAGASIGKGAGNAGQSIGKGAGNAGESVGRFFSHVPWTGKKKGS